MYLMILDSSRLPPLEISLDRRRLLVRRGLAVTAAMATETVCRQRPLAVLGISRMLLGHDGWVRGVVRLLHAVRLVGAVARGHGRVQVDEEGEDVKGENEGDDPLEDGGLVVALLEVGGDEGDGEEQLDDDED